KKGLTQKELAELLKVSAQAVSKWERGGTPDILLLVPLAKALGISLNLLLDYAEND
ncbi:MAG: helix-turn-helix transcriptional regulator, partial [Clostridia bacterium]|nr:helix-turn-helix transcriptional regulator [Clostridia bacterium]